MCWKCLSDVDVQGTVSFSAECPVCHADLHSCRNCVYYAQGSHYDCHETVDELIIDKERSNFCDYFKLKVSFSKDKADKGLKEDPAAKAKKAFDSLFSI